ncbi:hypothetical protein M231_01545 [Tremella mesenterica]|uniref:Uncharacterized protein n=1 Tax=Tremella mesenterica TaxID=5217 RepID=A0A4Q1BT93_TREME|nr:hypothetical protein M231_01545 [Tremella mesenterica]
MSGSINFSPYQPPPDVPSTDPPSDSNSLLGGRGKGKAKRPWFNRDASYANTYQSGGNLSDPSSVPQAYTNDPESSAYAGGSGMNGSASEDRANAWESRFGWRVDVMAAATYLGGPITALIFLILETQNDYVRFHAYQSALLTTPLLALLLLFNLVIRLPTFLRVLLILGSICVTLYASFRAWKDAQEGLGRYWLPYIGEIAEKSMIPASSHKFSQRATDMSSRWSNEFNMIIYNIRHRHLLRFILLILSFICLLGLLTFHLPPPSFLPSPNSHYHPISPFRVPPTLFRPPPDPSRPTFLSPPLAPKKNGMVVPNSVHYVYGLKPVKEGEKVPELPYYAYLAMKSALMVLKPEKMYFHYVNLPTGPWWDLISPHLTLTPTIVPHSVFGNELNHFAHQADILRLMIMKHMGGIYLDIDMFIIKPFDDLMYESTTLAMEMSPDSRRDKLDPTGLCNAVIVSEPGSVFINRWLTSYDTFNQDSWARHSVEIPWEIARRYPDEIQVLNHKAFFWPMWHGDEVQRVHERNEYDFWGSGQYA